MAFDLKSIAVSAKVMATYLQAKEIFKKDLRVLTLEDCLGFRVSQCVLMLHVCMQL